MAEQFKGCRLIPFPTPPELLHSLNWTAQPVSEDDLNRVQRSLGCGRITATLLCQRINGDEREMRKFLAPRLSGISDPFSIRGMDQVVSRVLRARINRERIHVFGDYDVDGVSSTVLMVQVLSEIGCSVSYSMPRRNEEGYGLTLSHVEKVVSELPVDIWMALDCGSNAHASIRFLQEKGVDVIVIDHHQVRNGLPEKVIMINPHTDGCECRGQLNLCTGALVFKLIQALMNRIQDDPDDHWEGGALKDYLDLVALACVTDLVPLVQENRVLVHFGLQRLSRSTRPGIQALMDVAGIDYGQTLDASDISYKLGPRINAGGRLNDAMLPVRLLLSQDFNSCVKDACELEGMNQERQFIERCVYASAIQSVENNGLGDRHGLVLYDPEWHTGVVGIVSNRLVRQLNRPVIVLGNEGAIAKGSCRGVDGLDMVGILDQCSDYLIEWGGHPMAAGLSLHPDAVPGFSDRFNALVSHAKPVDSGFPVRENGTKVDLWVTRDQIDRNLTDEIRRFGPFGICNPEPILGLRNVPVARAPVRFGSDHYKFWVGLDRHEYDLICLSWNGTSNMPSAGKSVDILFRLKWHEWRGKGYPEATLVEWRYSGD